MYLVITTPSGFEKHAKKEAESVLLQLDPGSIVRYTYFKGVLLAELSYLRNEVLEKLGTEETRYINRVIPLEAECKDLSEAVAFFENAEVSGKKFAVRCVRRGTHSFSGRDVEVRIGTLLKKRGGVVDLDEPEVLALVEIIQDSFFVGLARRSDVLAKKPAVVRKWDKGERPVSRAELKMREVMKRYPDIFQEGYMAMDIGAAPGGWSRAMASKVKKVWAVDPGELDEEVANLENVVHIRSRAEKIALDEKVDILTNDANITPMESASISVKNAREHLKRGGHLVHTVKIGVDPDTRRAVAKSLNHAALEVIREFQGKGFEILSKFRLKYNTRNEATIVARYSGNEE